MLLKKKVAAGAVTSQYLCTLDKSHLVELLDRKTKLLLTARSSKTLDRGHINILKQQVELIQQAIITAGN